MMVGGLKLNFRIGFARSPRPMTYMNSFTQACRFLGPLWEDSQRESAYQHPKVSTEGQRPAENEESNADTIVAMTSQLRRYLGA